MPTMQPHGTISPLVSKSSINKHRSNIPGVLLVATSDHSQAQLPILPPEKFESCDGLLEDEENNRTNETVEWWLAQNHHVTHKGTALDFSRRKYQPPILKDRNPFKCFQKSVQCGVSELLTITALSYLDQGIRVFWTVPDDRVRNRFVPERFDTVLQLSPYYRRLVALGKTRTRGNETPADSRALKQLGLSVIAFVGTRSKSGMVEFVADVRITDEMDRSDLGVLAMADDRLADSEYRYVVESGNPTIEGYGISEVYNNSDQRQWWIKCPHCNEWQTLDWFKNVVVQEGDNEYKLLGNEPSILCVKCSRPLDRYADGEWIARKPPAKVSGYHISQLFAGTRTIDDLYERFQKAQRDQVKMMVFWNSVLGLPYKAKGHKLFRSSIQECLGDYGQENMGNGLYMGVDVGTEIHVVVGEANRVTAIHCFSGDAKYHDLVELIERYDALTLIDGDYDPTEVRNVRKIVNERTKGYAAVYLCTFNAPKNIETWVLDKTDKYLVKASRLMAMDESHADIVRRDVQFPRDTLSVPDFVDQMCAPVRILVERETASGALKHVFEWTEHGKPDHYRLAFCYYRLISHVRSSGGAPIGFLKKA